MTENEKQARALLEGFGSIFGGFVESTAEEVSKTANTGAEKVSELFESLMIEAEIRKAELNNSDLVKSLRLLEAVSELIKTKELAIKHGVATKGLIKRIDAKLVEIKKEVQ